MSIMSHAPASGGESPKEHLKNRDQKNMCFFLFARKLSEKGPNYIAERGFFSEFPNRMVDVVSKGLQLQWFQVASE